MSFITDLGTAIGNAVAAIKNPPRPAPIPVPQPKPLDTIAPPSSPPPAAPNAEAKVDSMIRDIIRREGGYNDVKGDQGGATNLGISLRYLKGVGLVRGDLDHDGDIDKDDIRLVTAPVAAMLYKQDFYQDPRINRLPENLQAQVFDMAINHGPPRAIILFQKALAGATGEFFPADGVIGPETRTRAENAIAKLGAKAVNNAVVNKRIAFYNAIVAEDPSQQKFLRGWQSRAKEFLQ